MGHSLSRVLVASGCAAVLAATVGCAVDGSAHPTLSATYNGHSGFGFDPVSAARLAELLGPTETVEVVVGGKSTPLAAMRWSEVAHLAEPVTLEATDGKNRRSLAELRIDVSAEVQSVQPAPEDATPSANAQSLLVATSCTNNAQTWFCDNCMCSPDGTILRGESQLYICIYGSWYPENVYACNCRFTTNICGPV